MNVHVLIISHPHGENVSVHRTEGGALAALLDYVMEWWHDVMDGEPPPKDWKDAIDIYFERMADNGLGHSESYLLEMRALEL